MYLNIASIIKLKKISLSFERRFVETDPSPENALSGYTLIGDVIVKFSLHNWQFRPRMSIFLIIVAKLLEAFSMTRFIFSFILIRIIVLLHCRCLWYLANCIIHYHLNCSYILLGCIGRRARSTQHFFLHLTKCFKAVCTCLVKEVDSRNSRK